MPTAGNREASAASMTHRAPGLQAQALIGAAPGQSAALKQCRCENVHGGARYFDTSQGFADIHSHSSRCTRAAPWSATHKRRLIETGESIPEYRARAIP